MIRRALYLFFVVITVTASSQTGPPPIILNYTETARAGDVIYLQGSNFGNHPFVEYSYNDVQWAPLPLLNFGHGLLTIKLPRTETRLPDLLTVRVSADKNTWSAPAYLNRARAISLDTDQVAAGDSFRIFGRNLYFARPPKVQLVDGDIHLSTTADTANSSSYVLSVKAPAGVIPGHSYRVVVSNGYTGNGTTGGETFAGQTLLGRAAGIDHWDLGVPWAADLNFYANIYNVKTDTRLSDNAVGDGSEDDTAVLQKAVRMAGQAGGGVVFLPAGQYRLVFSEGCGLKLPNRVVVMGEGKDVTTLNYGYGTAPPPEKGGYAVCFANQTGVSDLTLNNVNESGHWPQAGLGIRAQELFLQRVNWNLSTSQWITLTSSKYLTIQNSKIRQRLDPVDGLGPLNIENCSQCEVKGNTIEFATRGIVLDSMNNGVFENNEVIRDISKPPGPRSVTHSIAANSALNLMILNNRFQSRGSALATNNDGETINSEGGGPIRFDEFRGAVSASSDVTLTDANQDFHHSGNSEQALRANVASVAIVSGNGLGQVRMVTAISADGHTLTIEHAWDAPVETGSHYSTFDWSASNWVIAHNTLTGNFKGIEIFNGSASDVLIQSNVMTDSGGIMISPTQQPPGLFHVIRNLEIIDNRVTDQAGWRPAYIGLIPREDGQQTSFGTAILGARVTGNRVIAHLLNAAVANPSWDDFKAVSEGYLNYWFWQSAPGYSPKNTPPPILGTIFQSNSTENSRASFVLNTGAAQTVILDMRRHHVQGPDRDEAIPGSRHGSEGTIIQEQ